MRWSFRQFRPSKEWKVPITLHNKSTTSCSPPDSGLFFLGGKFYVNWSLWKKNYKYPQFSKGFFFFTIAFEGLFFKDTLDWSPEEGLLPVPWNSQSRLRSLGSRHWWVTQLPPKLYLATTFPRGRKNTKSQASFTWDPLSQHSTCAVCLWPPGTGMATLRFYAWGNWSILGEGETMYPGSPQQQRALKAWLPVTWLQELQVNNRPIPHS